MKINNNIDDKQRIVPGDIVVCKGQYCLIAVWDFGIDSDNSGLIIGLETNSVVSEFSNLDALNNRDEVKLASKFFHTVLELNQPEEWEYERA